MGNEGRQKSESSIVAWSIPAAVLIYYVLRVWLPFPLAVALSVVLASAIFHPFGRRKMTLKNFTIFIILFGLIIYFSTMLLDRIL